MPKIGPSEIPLKSEDDDYRDEMNGSLRETGPWHVEEWAATQYGARPRIVLQSDDFTHDVALVISGDFYDTAQQIKYAQRLADRMNRMPKE
jgi:hypothetical protein